MIDVGRIKQAHNVFLNRLVTAVDGEVAQAAAFGIGHVRQFPRGFKHHTGRLAAATTSKVTSNRYSWRVALLNRAQHAGPIDRGARAHVIAARRAPLLVFYWPKLGRMMYLKSVNHPGNKPYRFLWRATRAAFRVAVIGIGRAANRIASQF